MATDSDVEAYLNQLSKKTYTLKQDAKTLVYSSSRPTSTAEEPSDDELESSDKSNSPVRTHKLSSLTQRKDIESLSDIAALSKKYEDTGHRKTYSYDKISNLEEKYLKKHKASKDVARSEISKSTNRQVKIGSDHAAYRRQPRLMSDSSSVDEELARYLNETSLTDELDGNLPGAGAVTKNHSSSEICDDSIDEVINFNNILTVNDILGQVTDSDSKSDHKSVSRKCEGEIISKSKNSVNEKDLAGAIGSDIDASGKTSLFVKNKNTASNSLQVKLSDVDNKDPSQISKHKKFPDNKEKEKNILLNSRKSLFYSGNQQDDDSDEPVGVLLAQTSSNVFHSSRRNSLIEFKKESITKSKTSKSNTKNNNKPKLNSDESILESIATSIRSSTVASVVETEPGTISSIDQEVEENFVKSAGGSQAGESQIRERIQKDALNGASDTEQSLSLKVSSPVSRECSQDNHMQEKYTTSQSTRKHKRPESSRQRKGYKSKNIVDTERRTKYKKSDRSSSKHTRKSRQHSNCKKNRISTSESSSESGTSDSESDCHHRCHSRHRKHRSKPVFSPWFGLPHMQLWPQHHQTCAASTEIFSHYPSPLVAEGLFGMSSLVGVKDVMRQQVALTRQFLDSQQALYHAYTATLTSSHRYTSLSNTEKYIKKRKPPLTFSEAYKLVKEEMKASEG